MKLCPYCGAEYPDDVMVCPIDRQPLPDLAQPQSLLPDEATGDTLADTAVLPKPQTESAAVDSAELIFPDYRWSARDAWKYVALMVMLQFLFDAGLVVLDSHFPGFYGFRVSGPGFFSVAFLYYVVALLALVYFARTESFSSFCKAVGLDRKPSNLAWFGVVCILAVRVLGRFILINGWSKGVEDYDIDAFRHALGPERYFFLIPLLFLAPLFEECIFRGFLYKAFRGSFSVATSMIFVIGWTGFTHWSQYSVSWMAALVLSLWTIVQCYIREKSDSLWDCIFCHAAFNWSLLFIVFH